MNEENHLNSVQHKIPKQYNIFIGILGLITTISYILRMLETGINILTDEIDASKEKIESILKRNIQQAVDLLIEINLTNTEVENLIDKFTFIMNIKEVNDRLKSVCPNFELENSATKNVFYLISENINIEDINLILAYIKEDNKLVNEIKYLFLEKLI